tara:strand:+ start:434 stop:667 length:234 start_codon:yes stop_codon:yes gene_type:complete
VEEAFHLMFKDQDHVEETRNMFSRRIARVKDEDTYPFETTHENKRIRISNIHRIPPALQKTYIQMITTYRTGHYTST